ncbi:hypothetical protein [Nocardiopsis alba]|jgi:hypothetical protein|uniref:hypothetical protein n=1 Tax=Nocardiopsis alba TaxID=53437 RepID=UPI0033B262F1
MLVRAIGGAFVGALIGFFVSIIAAVSTVSMSFLTESTVEIPYVIESSFKEVGGLPELHFTPNFPGILSVIAIFGMATMIYTVTTGRLQNHRTGIVQ